MSLLQAKKEAVAREVHVAKELADTSRHCSLKQQMLILELFHSSLLNSRSDTEGRNRHTAEAELSTVDTVDEMDDVEADVVPLHEPSPLIQLSLVLISSKIKVCLSLLELLATSLHAFSSIPLPFFPVSSLLTPTSSILTSPLLLVHGHRATSYVLRTR